MTETFEHPDDHADDASHAPEQDEPGYVEDQPLADDELVPYDDLSVDEPHLPEPGTEGETPARDEVWHSDPAADDELRSWLDAGEPALEPPPGFDQRLADDLTAEADRHGQKVDELVRDVLDRLRRS